MSATTQEYVRPMPGTAGTATTTTTAGSMDGKSYTSSTSAGTLETPSLHAPQPIGASANNPTSGRANPAAGGGGGHAKTDSVAASASSTTSLERQARRYEQEIDRLRSPELERQRAELTEVKAKQLDHLSLGAKIERACARRMVGQDAELRSPSPTKSTFPASTTTAVGGGHAQQQMQQVQQGVKAMKVGERETEKELGQPISEGRSAL